MSTDTRLWSNFFYINLDMLFPIVINSCSDIPNGGPTAPVFSPLVVDKDRETSGLSHV